MQKQGLSTIIATVLIIFLTVIVAGMIAQVIIPFAKNSLYKSTECVKYENYFRFDESLGWNCYDTDAKQINISLSVRNEKALTDNVLGFKIAFLSESFSKVIDVNEGASAANLRNFNKNAGSKITIPKTGDTFTYTYNYADDSVTHYTNAEVYTVLKSGRLCEKPSAHISLIDCRERLLP